MNSIQNRKSKNQNWLLPWLDVLAITAWGILMLKYWLTGKLNLLIHLIILVSDCRVELDCRWVEGMELLQRRYHSLAHNISPYFPGFSGTLLLAAAILGLLITPRVCQSDRNSTRRD